MSIMHRFCVCAFYLYGHLLFRFQLNTKWHWNLSPILAAPYLLLGSQLLLWLMLFFCEYIHFISANVIKVKYMHLL